MSVYTPKGIKVRISVDVSFALMARLYPKVSAFRVLKTTEGVDEIPTTFGFIASLICLFNKVDPVTFFIATLISIVCGLLIKEFGIALVVPGIIPLGGLYNTINILMLPSILLVILSYILIGWQAVVAYIGARFVAWIISFVLEFVFTSQWKNKMGYAFTGSERSFFAAYCYYARKQGRSIAFDLTDEELEPENWEGVFDHLADTNPHVVQRFTAS
ncbi:hypothetical protein [Paenibacillus sp. GP183]|uniref:hypothetical protein n=1 Tax=Paenibacillus sp. GP183 TaxID=1882751 RepID=UPI00089AF452|nr:hypothetical protein [Paenibacillus sp. GP183]SED17924.1 hypothetical protein SAMN05443246_5970 [Paenibacillus sp. GP183]